jgi:predicted PurR-regulated permease PerM
MYKIWLLSVTSLSLLILFQTPGLPGALLMAIIGFYFLYPLTQWLWHKTGSWKLSVWISYIGGGVFLATLLGFLGVEVREQVQEFKTLLPQLQMTVTHTIETLNHRDWSGLGIDSESINKAGQSLAQWLLGLAQWAAKQLPQWISDSILFLFLSPFFMFFLLWEFPTRKQQILALLPTLWQDRLISLGLDFNKQLGGFIRARFWESLIVGGLTAIGLAWIKTPFAMLLAVVTGLLNIIPYLGPALAASLSVLLALTTQEPGFNSLAVLILFLIVQTLDAFVIVPFFISKVVRLHPAVVIISVLLGAEWGGMLGMIVAIPAAGILKILLEHSYRWTQQSG